MASMAFTRAGKYPYRKGRIFLGKSVLFRRPVGIQTDRHLITVAGSRTGKGAALIMPNLQRWEHSTLIIDPKGEAAEEAVQWRADMGQAVHVLDPFRSARVPSKFFACYNPLNDLDPDGLSIKEDLAAVADGIVMRRDPSAAYWDNGAQAIIGGLIAFVKTQAPEDRQNLIEVYNILTSDDDLNRVVVQMKNMDECAGACRAAAAKCEAKEGAYFISNARENIEWIGSKAMRETLSSSSFSMDDLKRKKTSVFLVLPVNYLNVHGRFLRLFTRTAIEAMAKKMPDGELVGEKCLFILDEFYSLGRIDEIQKSAGAMPGYGLHLWPFLQDLGQLEELYDFNGATTFFSSADAHIFFGNGDPKTLTHISREVGIRQAKNIVGLDTEEELEMSNSQIKRHVAKHDRDKVARRMIVFAKGDDMLSLRLAPYFQRSLLARVFGRRV